MEQQFDFPIIIYAFLIIFSPCSLGVEDELPFSFRESGAVSLQCKEQSNLSPFYNHVACCV